MRDFKGFRHGINLGGWLSQCVHTEDHYRAFISASDFSVIRNWGADHVRIPVDYEVLEEEDGTPKESGLRLLRQAIGWARGNSLRVILDLHKTAGFSFDPDEHETGFFDNEAFQERFYALWERLSSAFGQEEDVAFELLNEVTEKSYCAAWNRIAAECIRRIRRIAPDSKILVGGYYHNSAAAVKDISLPDTRNIIFNFHCYEPLIFTHQGADWIPTMDPEFRISVRASYAELEKARWEMLNEPTAGFEGFDPSDSLSSAFFEDFFSEAVRAAEAADVPLYCGEHGVIDRAAPEDALAWYRLIYPVFEKYGIGRAAWSYKEMDFGLADARMDAVREELLKVL